MVETIDNLGPDRSKRYADDQKLYDSKFSRDASSIPSRAEVPSLSPATGALEQVFKTQTTVLQRASFSPPPTYFERMRRVFATQLTPSIGPEAKWDAISEKVLELLKTTPEGTEKKALEHFIETANKITQSVVDIKTKISQYHKG